MAGDGVVRISSWVLGELVARARAGLPNEVCGVAGGLADPEAPAEVTRLYPLENASASPERYTVDPAEQLAVYRQMADDGLPCVAVYHSHPATPARPSTTDIAEAYDPDVAYIIVSLAEEEPSVRAFSIREGEVRELTIESKE